MFRSLRTSFPWMAGIITVILVTLMPFQHSIGLTDGPNSGASTLDEKKNGSSMSYSLQLQDIVAIQVFGEEELNKTQRIDGSGNIRMDLIGTIQIAGLSLRQAEAKLEESYVNERFLRNPQVSIQIVEYAPKFISVLGQVNTPGRIQLEIESTGMRLVDAISAAGGFSGIAKSDAIRITRTAQNGSEQTVIIDADALINGRQTEIPKGFNIIEPGDVVFVPERLF